LEQTRQTLEKLDKSKSDFIAVAAHELKTPLTLIEGYASMLVENHERVNTDESELQLLNGIRNGTRRLRSIIDDMIDVSLIDTNLLLINFQPVWINRLLTALQNELGYSVKERNLELIINPFEGSDELTFGDPERLLQVFRNLISNAVKFTPDGGKILVDGRKLPGFFEIIISDTGIGIDPEDQMIIFDKFTRIGSTSLHSSGKTKFKGGGPGLGLHIAKGIIEGHGGAIWVESAGYDEKNCPGSTFHVMLPVHSVPPDDKMAKLFEPLIHNQQAEEKIE
jgi:signal transduction histidine kinase